MKEEKCNGWTNHETWEAGAMIDNVEEMYLYYTEIIQNYNDAKKFALKLQKTFYSFKWVRDNMTRGEILKINWMEIAESMMEEKEE